MLFDGRAHAFSGNHSLCVIGIQEKRGELFAAKTRAHVAGAQRFLDDCADLFQGFAPNQMAKGVVHFFEIIEIRHQHAERHRLGLSACGFPAQLGKKRFARQQAGKIVVYQQAVNLLLKLAVDLVEHFKADQLIADFKLVAIMQEGIIDGGAVENRAVGRIEIGQTITRLGGLLARLSRDARMQARSARVAYPHVSFQRATQSYFFAVQRDGHGQQFAAQKDQRRPAFALLPILAGKRIDFVFLYYRNVVRAIRHLDSNCGRGAREGLLHLV